MKKQLIRQWIGVLLGWCWITLAQGQPQGVQFRQPLASADMTKYSISSMLQDSKGFLWIGTWLGLMRYDGYSIKTYQANGNSTGLGNNKVINIYEDSRQRIWVGTYRSGVYVLDPTSDQFVNYRHQPNNDNSLSNDIVYDFLEDQHGRMWIATENGLTIFDEKNGRFERLYHREQGANTLSSNHINALLQTQDKAIWAGTRWGMNRIVADATGKPAHIERYYFGVGGDQLLPAAQATTSALATESVLNNNYVYALYEVPKQPNVVWVGTKGGLRKVAGKQLTTFDTSSGLQHNFVRAMESHHNELWIATMDGLNRMDLTTERFIPVGATNELSNNTIICLLRDNANVLWMGTEKGCNMLHLHSYPFSYYRFAAEGDVNGNIVSAVAADALNSDVVWVGTRGNGIERLIINQKGRVEHTFTYTFPQHPDLQLAGFINNLVSLPTGELWLATNGAGAFSIKSDQLPYRDATLSGYTHFKAGEGDRHLAENYAMVVQAAPNNDVWIGFWDMGIHRYDHHTARVHRYTRTLDHQFKLNTYPVVALLETTNRTGQRLLWVGTRGNGVYLLDFDEARNGFRPIKHFVEGSPKHPLSNNFITEIHQDAAGNVWIATEYGLNLINTSHELSRVYTSKDGMPDDILLGVRTDAGGNVWVEGKNGVFVMKQYLASMPQFRSFAMHDNLSFVLFSNTLARNQRNQIIMGNAEDLTIFSPQVTHLDSSLAQPAIVGFRLFNRLINIGEQVKTRVLLPQTISSLPQITLYHNENNFTFEFAALHFAHPDNNKFAYQLEGYDNNWIETDASRRFVTYTNLPYRTYTFKVKVANYDGVWNETPATIKVTIAPPFWLTGWAYAFYTVLGVGLLYAMREATLARNNLTNKIAMERLQREQADQLTRSKLEFFTNVSHEIRTPLTLIISPLEDLAYTLKDHATAQVALTQIRKHANRLLGLVNQLLDFTKTETGAIRLSVREQDIVGFVADTAAAFKEVARRKAIALHCRTPDAPLLWWFDAVQLEKVLFNLLSNALKFTPPNGEIIISLQHIVDKVMIQVSDNGIGIAESDLPFIFDRFYQGTQGNTPQQGTGIGLALAKSIAEQHGGTLTASSQQPQGATFILTLPAGKAHFTAQQIEIASPAVASQPTPAEVATTDAALPPLADGSDEQDTLLIAEDNADIRDYLVSYFTPYYKVVEATNGSEALHLAHQNPPTLVISDLAMPVMDGLQLCKALKTNIVTNHIPIILLTARTDAQDQWSGLDMGADDYVTKPFNMALLAKRVSNLIAGRKQLQEKFSVKNFTLQPSQLVAENLDAVFLEKVRSVIEAHIADTEFSVEALSRALLMSNVQFYRKLKDLTGKTPVQLIRSMRLQRAAQLLASGNYSVTETTYKVGFQDLKYFREQFKKEFGVNPSEYTKQ